MRSLALLLSMMLLVQGGVSAKWSFGYGTAAIADAVADSIKMKAKHIADKTEVLPNPQPQPTKEKDFSYTSIKLKSQMTGTENETENILDALTSANAQNQAENSVKPPQYGNLSPKEIIDSIYEKYGLNQGKESANAATVKQMEGPESTRAPPTETVSTSAASTPSPTESESSGSNSFR